MLLSEGIANTNTLDELAVFEIFAQQDLGPATGSGGNDQRSAKSLFDSDKPKKGIGSTEAATNGFTDSAMRSARPMTARSPWRET